MPTSSYESDSDLILRSNNQSTSISTGDTSSPWPDSPLDFEARSASNYSEGDPESVLKLFPNESDESDSCMEELEEVKEHVEERADNADSTPLFNRGFARDVTTCHKAEVAIFEGKSAVFLCAGSWGH